MAERRSFFGYVDFTLDKKPFYVGIGNEKRFMKLGHRNTKHKGICRKHGQCRELKFQSNDWEAMKRWEVASISTLNTYHYDNPTGIGCNFTRGGDGTLGWQPTDETRKKWSSQRKGNTYWKLRRSSGKGVPRPSLSAKMKGRKRPDLSVIMTGKKRGPYKTSEASRLKQGATNRGKHLSADHRAKIGVAGLGRKVSEETRIKLRKKRTPEQRERYRLAALKRWEKKRNEC